MSMLRRHRGEPPVSGTSDSDVGEAGLTVSPGEDFDVSVGEASELDRSEVGEEEVEERTWCETCRRRVDPDAAAADWTCPDCGEALVARRNVPWTFKLMLVATVVYLGYRLYQGMGWVVHHV
jgi:predicted RNA-binding Zn-ribbon protein involved in translation (DUF1610 family)